jgi:hypothetical protein
MDQSINSSAASLQSKGSSQLPVKIKRKSTLKRKASIRKIEKPKALPPPLSLF